MRDQMRGLALGVGCVAALLLVASTISNSGLSFSLVECSEEGCFAMDRNAKRTLRVGDLHPSPVFRVVDGDGPDFVSGSVLPPRAKAKKIQKDFTLDKKDGGKLARAGVNIDGKLLYKTIPSFGWDKTEFDTHNYISPQTYRHQNWIRDDARRQQAKLEKAGVRVSNQFWVRTAQPTPDASFVPIQPCRFTESRAGGMQTNTPYFLSGGGDSEDDKKSRLILEQHGVKVQTDHLITIGITGQGESSAIRGHCDEDA